MADGYASSPSPFRLPQKVPFLRRTRAADLPAGQAFKVLFATVEKDGWQADYQALTPDGHFQSIHAYLTDHPEIQTVDAVARLRSLAT